jgi:hypothetical protein
VIGPEERGSPSAPSEPGHPGINILKLYFFLGGCPNIFLCVFQVVGDFYAFKEDFIPESGEKILNHPSYYLNISK